VTQKKYEKRYKKVKNEVQISRKNEAILQKKFEEEIQVLLERQKEKQTELELVLQRATSYAETVYELRSQLNEYFQQASNVNVVQEMEQIRKSNEELVKSIHVLETDISESIKKTEDLSAWLCEILKEGNIQISEKLETTMGRVTTLVERYQQLKRELYQLSSRQGEMVVYVEWLDKELKRERAKRMAHAKKYKAWEEKRELLSHIGDHINPKLSELVEFNLKGMDSINTLLSQLKTRQSGSPSPTYKTLPGSSKRTPEVPALSALVLPVKRAGSPTRSTKRPAGLGGKRSPGKGGKLAETTQIIPEQEDDAFGSLASVKEGMLKMKEKKILYPPSPQKNVGRTHSEGRGPLSFFWSEGVSQVFISSKDQNPAFRVARRVKSTNIPERRAM